MMQAKNRLDMPTLRRRIRKEMKRRYGKVIKLSQVDKVWKEYVQFGIVDPLLKYGEVKVEGMTIDVIGKRILNDKRLFNLFVNNRLARRNGTVNDNPSLNTYRPDVVYKIRLTDKNFKDGKLYFTADKKIRKQLVNALNNTNNYYKITDDVD